MDIDTHDLVSLAVLALGGAVVLGALLRLIAHERRAARARSEAPAGSGPAGRGVPSMSALVRGHPAAAATALAIAVAALIVALEGIERRGMSHVEVYVPGIELPREISTPPPRIGLAETVWWHLHSEPHPPAYYWGMWIWTRGVGTSLASIRLPSVLFGVGAVILAFFLGGAVYGAWAGVLAAGLLAFNGHHVYWMQQARMYELSLFLALLSLWCWARILSHERRRGWTEVGYVGSGVAGVYTQVFFWPFLAAQALVTFLAASRRRGPLHRASSLQALIVILGSPALAHAVYHARHEPQEATSLAFAQDFFDFGFLFRPDTWSAAPRDIPWLPELLLTLVALGLLWVFVRDRSSRWEAARTPARLSTRHLLAVGIGVAILILAWSREVYGRNALVAATGVIPLAAAASVPLLASRRSRIARWRGRWEGAARGSPLLGVALATLALACAIGLVEPWLVSRGLLVAVPPYLIALGAGLAFLLRRSVPTGVLVLVAVAAAHAWSVLYWRDLPHPNDHRGLAEQIAAELGEDDLILVPPRDWVTTPIFYHLDGHHHRLVARDYAAAIESSGATRVWVLQYSDIPVPGAIADAVASFTPALTVEALRSRGTLYVRPPTEGP